MPNKPKHRARPWVKPRTPFGRRKDNSNFITVVSGVRFLKVIEIATQYVNVKNVKN